MTIIRREITQHLEDIQCDDCGRVVPGGRNSFQIQRCAVCGKHTCNNCWKTVDFPPYSLFGHADYPDHICKACVEVFEKDPAIDEIKAAEEKFDELCDKRHKEFKQKCLDKLKPKDL